MRKIFAKHNATKHQTERKAADNSRLASCGVKCKLEALCFYSSSVLVDNLVFQNPPLRQAPKRYSQLLLKISFEAHMLYVWKV
jgi:hypothetical protein